LSFVLHRPEQATQAEMAERYVDYFPEYVACGIKAELLDPELVRFDLKKLAAALKPERDLQFLFNAGTLRPQLSSCFPTTVPDDLDGIFKSIKDNALLSKYAGGLGNDWTRVRGLGAHIKGTNGESQGIVPFLKVANDTAIAVNQGGKRKGAVCAYPTASCSANTGSSSRRRPSDLSGVSATAPRCQRFQPHPARSAP
jgi:ribonucleotide reductase alpha subunit